MEGNSKLILPSNIFFYLLSKSIFIKHLHLCFKKNLISNGYKRVKKINKQINLRQWKIQQNVYNLLKLQELREANFDQFVLHKTVIIIIIN